MSSDGELESFSKLLVDLSIWKENWGNLTTAWDTWVKSIRWLK